MPVSLQKIDTGPNELSVKPHGFQLLQPTSRKPNKRVRPKSYSRASSAHKSASGTRLALTSLASTTGTRSSCVVALLDDRLSCTTPVRSFSPRETNLWSFNSSLQQSVVQGSTASCSTSTSAHGTWGLALGGCSFTSGSSLVLLTFGLGGGDGGLLLLVGGWDDICVNAYRTNKIHDQY